MTENKPARRVRKRYVTTPRHRGKRVEGHTGRAHNKARRDIFHYVTLI